MEVVLGDNEYDPDYPWQGLGCGIIALNSFNQDAHIDTLQEFKEELCFALFNAVTSFCRFEDTLEHIIEVFLEFVAPRGIFLLVPAQRNVRNFVSKIPEIKMIQQFKNTNSGNMNYLYMINTHQFIKKNKTLLLKVKERFYASKVGR